MKILKIAMAAMAAVVMLFTSAATAYAQNSNNTEQTLAQKAAEFNKALPMEVQKGMTFESVSIVDKDSVLELNFLLEPEKTGMGISTEEWKGNLEKLTSDQVGQMMGDDFKAFESLGLKTRVVFKLPDGYKRVIDTK